jgi:hypothetical protein
LAGQPLYAIVAYRWAGLNNEGNPQGYYNKKISTDYYNITNYTNKTDLIYKPALPVLFGSLINTFRWKEFCLIANITYRLGYYFQKPSLSYQGLFNGGSVIGSSDYSKRWQKPGDEKLTNVPSLQYPADGNRDLFYNNSAILVDKADNVKLQYISLSYNIDKTLRKALPFQQIQIYINASNLGILWKANKDGIDPDYISSTPPVNKSFSVGIKASL